MDSRVPSSDTRLKPWLKFVLSKRGGGKYPVSAILCDRSGPWGNPFNMRDERDRDLVCNQFETWLQTGQNFGELTATNARRQWILDNVHLLKERYLVCWCHPLRCHVWSLASRANGGGPLVIPLVNPDRSSGSQGGAVRS